MATLAVCSLDDNRVMEKCPKGNFRCDLTGHFPECRFGPTSGLSTILEPSINARALARVINGKRISSCEPSASDRAIGSRMWAYRC